MTSYNNPVSHDTKKKLIDDLPLKFGIVLFPGYQDIDVFGPVDVFNGLSWYLPNMELYFLSHDLKPVSTKTPTEKPLPTYGYSVTPTHTFDNPPHLDVLLVPGGKGTRASPDESNLEAVRKFVQETYLSRKLKYLLTVCTGSALIAPTGILDKRIATSNKRAWAWATQRKEVYWQERARWTQDCDIWTSSGITAGIDLAFAWVTHVYNNKGLKDEDGNEVDDIAKYIADVMEYTLERDPSNDPFCKRWGVCKCTDDEGGNAQGAE